MAVRFRRSISIAPGVKINVSKKSVGLSLGTKGLRTSINTQGRSTTSLGIPGTGLSYIKTGKINKNTLKKARKKEGFFSKKITVDETLAELTDLKIGAKVSQKHIESLLSAEADNQAKIVQDCITAIDKTKKTSVFFERWKLLLDTVEWLTKAQNYIDITMPNIENLLAQRPKSQCDFVDRYYQVTLDKIQTLKTDKAQANTLHAFFESLNLYASEMTPECMEHIESIRKRYDQ